MKYLSIVLYFFAMIGYFDVYAQKHDYIWIIGGNNTPTTTTHGGATIDFNYNPRKVYYNYRKINMYLCNASICDSLGRLVAYSNGCDIGGPDDDLLENGKDINQGDLHTLFCDERDDGYAAGFQSALMLPCPDSSNKFYYFYKHSVPVKNSNGNYIDIYNNEFRYATIQKRVAPLKNAVLQKDVKLLQDSLAYGLMAAVKHSNGKDWWIVVPRRWGNTFYVLKLSSEGITDTLVQTIGLRRNPEGEGFGQLVFAPDGTKLYCANTYDPILVYDFDRSTGRFTGFNSIPFTYGEGLEGEIGCAVSPNGRYLYLGARLNLWQLDLQAPDISASQTLVCK